MSSRLLLLSNSTMPGAPYLEWAAGHIRAFLGDVREVLFFPYAAVTVAYDQYAQKVRAALPDFRIAALHECDDPLQAVRQCRAMMVGGGNTFRLLERLQSMGLLAEMRARALAGVPYVGWSAGANIASPTLRTTNDMPIIQPASFEALNLVPFQLNPHYTEKAIPGFGGETRPERLKEFTALNPGIHVVGLREGDYIKVSGDRCEHGGGAALEIFHSSHPPRSLAPPASLEFLAGREARR